MRGRASRTLGLLAAGWLLLGGTVMGLEIREAPIFDAERLALTRDYGLQHYGRADAQLHDPRMIVVHFTTIATFADSYAYFAPNLLSRRDIDSGGRVNISVHFMVDRNGDIYRLAPESVICRHVIGFNHLALGIENVGRTAVDLTAAQLEANAALIDDLVRRYPGITYLIGHHEYQNARLPHFALHYELDPHYRPTHKVDPGAEFMTRLRALLWEKYQRRLLD